MTPTSSTTGAEVVVKALENLGIQKLFGIPGLHNLDIYDYLSDSSLEHITARHEQGVGFMADGYARTAGKPGVGLVISGPGLTNIITPMAQAKADSIPLLIISSQLPTSVVDQGTGYLHELKNSTYLARSAAKDSFRIQNGNNIPARLQMAYELAQSNRPGPVHVEIPVDILKNSLNQNNISSPATTFSPNPWQHTDQDGKLEKAADLIRNSEKAFIIAGGGSIKAGKELKKLMEKQNLPLLETVAGKGVVSEKHPLCLGSLIKFPGIKDRLKTAGAVLAVGTELAPPDTATKKLELEGKLIQIDIDAGNFNRGRSADIYVRGDSRDILQQLNKKLETAATGETARSERAFSKNSLKPSRKQLQNYYGVPPAIFNKMKDMLDILRQVLPEDGILVTDMTGPAYVGRSEYPAYNPRTFLHPVGFGSLGYALPAAIGANLAGDKKTAVLIGDGGFQFTEQSLGVIMKKQLNIPIIIWNNQGYGEIRKNERERHPGRTIAVDHESPDFKELAHSYHLNYEQINQIQELEPVLKKSFNNSPSQIIEVRVEGGKN